MSLSQRVSNTLDHLKLRIGKQVTYKRFKTYEYDPISGTVPTFWETPSFKAVVGSVSHDLIAVSGGLLMAGDRAIYFPKSAFTKQSGETSDPEPGPGDIVVIDGEEWGTDLGDGKTLWNLDPTGTMFTVYLRRRSG